MLSDEFKEAIAAACRKHKTQKVFSERSGIHQSRISSYATGRIRFEDITVGTLLKLFPDLRIDYFPSEESVRTDPLSELRREIADLRARIEELEEKLRMRG